MDATLRSARPHLFYFICVGFISVQICTRFEVDMSEGTFTAMISFTVLATCIQVYFNVVDNIFPTKEILLKLYGRESQTRILRQ